MSTAAAERVRSAREVRCATHSPPHAAVRRKACSGQEAKAGGARGGSGLCAGVGATPTGVDGKDSFSSKAGGPSERGEAPRDSLDSGGSTNMAVIVVGGCSFRGGRGEVSTRVGSGLLWESGLVPGSVRRARQNDAERLSGSWLGPRSCRTLGWCRGGWVSGAALGVGEARHGHEEDEVRGAWLGLADVGGGGLCDLFVGGVWCCLWW